MLSELYQIYEKIFVSLGVPYKIFEIKKIPYNMTIVVNLMYVILIHEVYQRQTKSNIYLKDSFVYVLNRHCIYFL